MLETNDLNRFLKELYDAKPEDKDFGGFVEAHKIGQSLGISDVEAEKLAKDLHNAGYIRLRGMGDFRVKLTDEGESAAHAYQEEIRRSQERKGR